MKRKPDAGTTHLYLIRHAATDANEQKPAILQGRGINGELSEQGRRQAAQLGEFLASFPLDRIYCSPMVRAMQTAQAVADHHAIEIATIEEFTEADVGRWEGMDWATIMQEYPTEYEAFMSNMGENPYLEGESYGDVLSRVSPVFERILMEHQGQTVVVVAHNVVNRAYLSGFLGVELRFAKGVRQLNTGMNFLRYRAGETSLITLNSVIHLDEIP